MTPSNTELLLLKEEISLTFGNGSSDGKAYCDLEDIFLWVFAHYQAREQQLKAEAEVNLRKDNDFIKALKRDVRQQILTELLGEAIPVEYEAKAGTASTTAVPVSVIEKYREGL